MDNQENQQTAAGGLIDVELWNKADWQSIFFAVNQEGPPILGLGFANRGAALRIFKAWNEKFGNKVDMNEELRVSIIEGSLPGESRYGYTVHIGTNKGSAAKGDKFKANLVEDVSRFFRMYPGEGSKNLYNFRTLYNQYGGYYLVPGHVIEDNPEALEMLPDYPVGKTELTWRRIEDIKPGDIDYVAIKGESQE